MQFLGELKKAAGGGREAGHGWQQPCLCPYVCVSLDPLDLLQDYVTPVETEPWNRAC